MNTLTAESGTRKVLLLIEDDLVDREVVHRLLEDEYEILDAPRGSLGLEFVRTRDIDCVLLDNRLPDAEGLELLAEIEDEPSPPAVVMMTGEGDEVLAVRALKGGAQDYLVKGSISRESLDRAIASAIERNSLSRKVRIQQEELRKFARTVARDLRAPLRRLSTLCRHFARVHEQAIDEEADDTLQLVVTDAERLMHLVDDLMRYSEVGSADLNLETVALADVVQTVVSTHREAVDAAKAQLNVGSLPVILGQENAIYLLMNNLVTNAIEFAGDEPLEIGISCEAEGAWWKIVVRDNGRGIPESMLETIFEPLHRGRLGGSGLGLATSRKVVEQHGGKIWCESTLGSGSTFSVMLPATMEAHD